MLFDLDGVVTRTATLHAAAWKRLFDEFLADRAAREGGSFEPFDIDRDYRVHVDGRPRYDGVAAFLASRGIHLARGDAGRPAGPCDVLRAGQPQERLLRRGARHARRRGLRRHGAAARCAAGGGQAAGRGVGQRELHGAAGSGRAAGSLRRPGDRRGGPTLGPRRQAGAGHVPQGCRAAGVVPSQAIVFEDAISGVQAGRAGGFGLVVGVDRHGKPEALADGGADMVLADLTELLRLTPAQVFARPVLHDRRPLRGHRRVPARRAGRARAAGRPRLQRASSSGCATSASTSSWPGTIPPRTWRS